MPPSLGGVDVVTLAYSYLRFSSTEQRKGNSLDRQVRGRDAYIARKGLTLGSSLIIEDAGVSAFRRIFDMAVKGHGIGSIAKTLNREGVPPISKAKHWYDSYVYKILVNRACIGEFQPRLLQIETLDQPGRAARKVKRFQPVGQPITNRCRKN
jgi:Recombinase